MKELILTAIREKKKLFVHYRGVSRIIEPYHYGEYNDQEIMVGLQTGGYSKAEDSDLQLFFLSKIDDLDILDVSFVGHAEYEEDYFSHYIHQLISKKHK